MENEALSKNFIEQIIERILRVAIARRSLQDFHQNLMDIFILDMPSLYY